MNPFSRFIKGFRYGYGTQRVERLNRETLARHAEESRRIENQAGILILGNRALTATEINFELDRGGRFIVFQYCISIIFRSYKCTSKIYLVKPGDNLILKGLPFTIIASLRGMWGIPWGPIWTIESIFTNFRGGRNITAEVLTTLNAAPRSQ